MAIWSSEGSAKCLVSVTCQLFEENARAQPEKRREEASTFGKDGMQTVCQTTSNNAKEYPCSKSLPSPILFTCAKARAKGLIPSIS